MGTSAAFDHLARQSEQAGERKRAKQRRRAAMLLEIMRGPGFGEHDGNNSLLEQEAAKAMQFAYEALSVISR